MAGRQDGVIRWDQLIALGFSRHAVAHRLATGRLHRLWPGVYAVGSPQVSRRGRWRAARYACGRGAALSHETAAAFWEVIDAPGPLIHVSVPRARGPRLAGIRTHRRSNLRQEEIVAVDGLQVTCPATTLIDIAAGLSVPDFERAVNKANGLDLIDPEALRSAIESTPRRPGLRVARERLDRRSFLLTDSELERRFIPLARRAGLGTPVTRERVNGFRVDFYWPQLGLVVETDGLRYHRTPAQQARDRVRDQAHLAAGLTPLRFTHDQVRYEPGRVEALLRTVTTRLLSAGSNR